MAPVSTRARGVVTEAPGSSRRSLFEAMSAQARACPAAPAIGAPGRPSLTYRELVRAMARTMDSLAGVGVRPGTCVALVLPDGPELAVACLGVAAGAVAAPLDPTATAPELETSFDALGARAVIVPAGAGEAARRAAHSRRLDLLELVPSSSSPAGTFAFRRGRSRADGAPGGPDDPALVLRTSGTTGLAKVVPFVQEQLDAAARHVVEALALTDQDRSLALMPLFHGHGLIAGLLAPLAAGGLVVCPGRFSALRFPAWLAQTRPTWYTAAPGMHRAILGRLAPGNRGVAALRCVRSASSPLSPALMAALEGTLRAPVIEAYGMTEAGHQIASNPLPPRARKPGSVGLPLGVELRVVNDSGTSLPSGRVGDIEIRGRTVSRGIAKPGEWFRTGDLGYLDSEGYLFLVGRRDETINRGGEKLSPGEVEAVLQAHPAVADAVAVPQADPHLGEVVSGLVVLNKRGGATARALREFASTRLAPAKVPHQIILVSEIPREATGKVARRRLAAAFGLDKADPAAPRPEGDSPESRLIAFVAGRLTARDDGPAPDLTGETSLVRSGLFDSLALVELAAWVEEESGAPLAPLEATRLAACDTVGDFAAFAKSRRSPRRRGDATGRMRPIQAKPLAGYTFTTYRPELRAQILDLQTHLWSPDRGINAACFEWKYERNPYLREPLLHLACRDGEVVAMRGFFGGRWETGRRRRAVDVPCAGDLVVAPAYRRRGLVPRLMMFAHADLEARGHALAFNLSAGSATFLASLRTGWRTTAPLEPLQRRVEPAPGAGLSDPPGDPFAALDAAAGAFGGALELAATARPGAMAALVARRPADGRIRHVRDARYLAWRFGNPLSRYRFLYWHGRGLEGYLVLRASSVRNGPVSLVDWEGGSARVRAALLEAALEWGRFPNMRAWGATLAAPERHLLERHGFRPPLPSPGRRRTHASTILVRSFGAARSRAWTLAGRRLLHLTSWDLRLLYSDGV